MNWRMPPWLKAMLWGATIGFLVVRLLKLLF